MNKKRSRVVLCSEVATFCAEPIANYPGVLANPDYHWEYQHSKDGEMVYIPFEGTFESKGGRIQSPKIKLDK
ncbi:MAG: hypothetical protein WCT05_10020, partial [Lentisphaeria bacterium]